MFCYSCNYNYDYSGDAQASQQQSTEQVDSQKYKRDLVLDLIKDGELSRPCLNANLIELMMAAVDTVSFLKFIPETFNP